MFGKCCLVYLGVHHLGHNQHSFGVAVAENAIKPLVLMYHKAMSKFLRSKHVLNLVYIWVEYIFGGLKCPIVNLAIYFGFFKNVLHLNPLVTYQ